MTFPEDYINKIIQGDCLEVMKGIPDKSIDLVVTDPPYGINQKNVEWDKFIPIEWFGEALRILKDDGAIYVFGDSLVLSKLQVYWEQKGIKWKGRAVWIYEDGPRNSRTWTSKHEDCLYYHAKEHVQATPKETSLWVDPRWGVERYIGDVWKFARISGNNNLREKHISQKPIKLIHQIINASSEEKDIILDCFLGSGTTVKAAQDLNRRFIGIEISPEYCQIAENRLKQGVLNF